MAQGSSGIGRSGRRGIAVAAGVFIVALALLWLMGRTPVCTCGTVKLWYGIANSSETSQHVFDWYSLSHVIHGFLFYGAMWFIVRNRSVGSRLAAAMTIEAAWEIFENTSYIIDRYREQTISLDYYGDSIINSAGDMAVMAIGFGIAARLPVWATVALGLALEALAAWAIRDNLTLNIVMLLWPLEPIRQWQMGG